MDVVPWSLDWFSEWSWWAVALSFVGGILLLWVALMVILWFVRPDELTVRDALRLLPDLIRMLRRLAADDTLPRRVRVILCVLLVYLLLPIDLIPDFVPVLGYADDAIIVAIALRFLAHAAGPESLGRHWPGTPDGLTAVRHLAGLPT
jgi:uncharacterized membrane protein YkvA (DUF1232 family)